MLRSTPPDPPEAPNCVSVGISVTAGTSAPASAAAALTASAPAPSPRRLIHAARASGPSSGHDMCTCMIQVTAAPIIACAIGGGTIRRLSAGTVSKKPMKNSTAAGRAYDGLLTWVENCSVHGTVRNQPQTSQRGARGRWRPAYHASAHNAANDSRFSSTNGDSGTGAMRSGTPTSSGCSAPGISLFVQTTSGPKYGQWPVA